MILQTTIAIISPTDNPEEVAIVVVIVVAVGLVVDDPVIKLAFSAVGLTVPDCHYNKISQIFHLCFSFCVPRFLSGKDFTTFLFSNLIKYLI